MYLVLARLWVALHGEEAYGAAWLKIMLYLRTRLTHYLHHHLVERVVVVAAYLHRKPCVATAHLALYAHGLGLAAKLLLLVVIFYLKKQTLLLKLKYWVVNCH